MSEAKHTPGPWTFDRYGKIIGANGDPVVLGGVSISCGRVSDDNPCHANDKIVCAAPELLEALEAVMEGSEYGEITQLPGTYCWKSRATPSHESLDKARAAIAKARGEA